jgi:hypothetical protein
MGGAAYSDVEGKELEPRAKLATPYSRPSIIVLVPFPLMRRGLRGKVARVPVQNPFFPLDMKNARQRRAIFMSSGKKILEGRRVATYPP